MMSNEYASDLISRRMKTLFGKGKTRQAFRLLTACALAGGCVAMMDLPENFWAVITAIVVMQPELSKTWFAGRDWIVATLMGALLGWPCLPSASKGCQRCRCSWPG